MDLKEVINQSGNITCPICLEHISWKYKMEKMCIDTAYGNRVSYSMDMEPHNSVSPTLIENGKVKFSITCPACRNVIETKELDLIQ